MGERVPAGAGTVRGAAGNGRRATAPPLPQLADPATAPDTAAACAAAALSRLAESIAEIPAGARLRIDGGPW